MDVKSVQSRIFRKKNLERITSPEQLQDYMRVTNPGIWMVLAAVIALLAGLIISSALATLESTVSARGVVAADSAAITMELPLSQKDAIAPGMPVRVAGKEAHISYVYQDEDALRVVAEADELEGSLPAGTYDAQIVTETLSPIRFLLN